jgi:hypothetical protein
MSNGNLNLVSYLCNNSMNVYSFSYIGYDESFTIYLPYIFKHIKQKQEYTYLNCISVQILFVNNKLSNKQSI